MLYGDFYNDFLTSYDNRDLKASAQALMRSMGDVAALDRTDFIGLLKECGLEGDFANMSDAQLVDFYVNSLAVSKPLKLGTAMLVNMKNQTSSADGEKCLSDDGVKAAYHTLCVFFPTPSENFSNAGGIVAGAVGEVAKFGSKLTDAQQKKKYAATDAAAKKAEAKTAMTQQLLAQRQTQAEAAKAKADQRSKTSRVLIIGSVVLAGLGITGFILYKVLK